MIRDLLIENFGCYRGEHHLALDRKVYGVAARHEDDAERSNWTGKSTLPRAVAWLLYGWRDSRSTRFDDDVITDGRDGQEPASQARARGILDCGGDPLVVVRTKPRGKPMKLEAYRLDGVEKIAVGDEAQKLVEEAVGLSERDFFWTAYFEQKQIARFVDAKPADRLKVAAEWFRFASLQEGEKKLRASVTALATSVDDMRRRSSMVREQILALEGSPENSIAQGVVGLEVAVNDAWADSLQAEGKLGALEELRDRAAGLEASRRDLARYRQVYEDGVTTSKELGALGDPKVLAERAKGLRQKLDEAVAVERAAYREHHAKDQLAVGEFDGQCPVSCKACPVAADINADRAGNSNLARIARRNYEAAKDASQKARSAHESNESVRRTIDVTTQKLEGLRAEGRRLKESARLASERLQDAPDEDLTLAVQAARERLVAARQVHAEATRRLGEHGRLAEALAAHGEQVAAMERELATHREALAIFGPNGAQRRVAEGALLEIESTANEVLAGCGIDLRLKVSWGREGKGLASTCEACGTPFGRSERVKRCDRCGADRGQLVEHRLDLEISDRSGAADDLAGAAFQLAAARWLRADRCAGWATVMLDEPFGALDAANRRAFANHLSTMLNQHGFAQAFVIAHHSSVVDAFPGRIDVVKSAVGVSLEVS